MGTRNEEGRDGITANGTRIKIMGNMFKNIDVNDNAKVYQQIIQ